MINVTFTIDNYIQLNYYFFVICDIPICKIYVLKFIIFLAYYFIKNISLIKVTQNDRLFLSLFRVNEKRSETEKTFKKTDPVSSCESSNP